MATNPIRRAVQHLRKAILRREGADLTDGHLLQDFVAHRDEAALEALVRRHGPMVRGACRRILRHPEGYWRLVLEGDKATLHTGAGGKKLEGDYTTDPDKKPKEIAFTFGSLLLRGIYELKGTKLKSFWLENAYPTDFDSKEGIRMIFEK